MKAKRANQERIKEFSRNLLNVNKSILSEQKKLPASNELQSIQVSKQVEASNRARAMEFAKKVPKPKVIVKAESSRKFHFVEKDDDGYEGAGDGDYMMQNDMYGDNYMTNAKLQQLESKHEDTRKQVDAIKKSLGLKG